MKSYHISYVINELIEIYYNLRSMNEVKWINKYIAVFISTDVNIYIKMVLLVLHSTVEKRKNNMNEFENVVLCYDASSVGT